MNFVYLNYFFIVLSISGFHNNIGVSAKKLNCTAMKSCNKTVCTNAEKNCGSVIDIADPFNTNSKNDEDVTKFIKPTDNDYYSTLCWIEITKIKDILTETGIERYVTREYAISVETPADFKNNINKNANFSYHTTLKFRNHHNNTDYKEIEPFEIYESDTKKSTVVNFTTVSVIDNFKVREHKKKICGAGPILITETNQWSNTLHKKLEIRVIPKKQKLKAAECNNQTKSTTIVVTEKPIITQPDAPSRRTEGNNNNLTDQTEHTTELSSAPKEKRIPETIPFAPIVTSETTKAHNYSSSFDPYQFPQGGPGDTPVKVTTISRTHSRKITTNPTDLLSSIPSIIGSKIAPSVGTPEDQKLEETTTVRETTYYTPSYSTKFKFSSVHGPPSNQTTTENIQETKTTSTNSINKQSNEPEEMTESNIFTSTDAITAKTSESTYNTISPTITSSTNVQSDATTTDDLSKVSFTEFVPPIITEEVFTDATTTAFEELTNSTAESFETTSEIAIQTSEQTTTYYTVANEPGLYQTEFEPKTTEAEITTPGGGKIASYRRIPNTKLTKNVSTDVNINVTQQSTTESVSTISTTSGRQETGTSKPSGIPKTLPEITHVQDIKATVNAITTTEVNTKLPDIVTKLGDLTTTEFTTINKHPETSSTKIKITSTESILRELAEVSTPIEEGSTTEMNTDHPEKISSTTEVSTNMKSTEIYLTTKTVPESSTNIDNSITATPHEIAIVSTEKNVQPTNIPNISSTETDTTEVGPRLNNMESFSSTETLETSSEISSHMKYFKTNPTETTNITAVTTIVSTEIVTTEKTLPEIAQSDLSTVNTSDETEVTAATIEMNKKLMTDIVPRIESVTSTETFSEISSNIEELTSFTTAISELNENIKNTENAAPAITSSETSVHQKFPKTKNITDIIDKTTENDEVSTKLTTSTENVRTFRAGETLPSTESFESTETDYPEYISAGSKEDTISTVVFRSTKIPENRDLISNTEIYPVTNIFKNTEDRLLSASTSGETTYGTHEYTENAVSTTTEETESSNTENESDERKYTPKYFQTTLNNELSTEGIVTNSIIDRIGTTSTIPEQAAFTESISYEYSYSELTTDSSKETANTGHTSDYKSTAITDKSTEMYSVKATVTETSLGTTKEDTGVTFSWPTNAQKSESVPPEITTVSTEKKTSRKYFRASDSVPESTNEFKEEIKTIAELITTPSGEISSPEAKTTSENRLVTSESTTDKTTKIANDLTSRIVIENETTKSKTTPSQFISTSRLTTEIESKLSTPESVLTTNIINERRNKTTTESIVSTSKIEILNEIRKNPSISIPDKSPEIPKTQTETTTPSSIETSTSVKTLNAKSNTSNIDQRSITVGDNKTFSIPVIRPMNLTTLKPTRRTNYPYSSTPILPTEKPSEITPFVSTACEVSVVSSTSKAPNCWPTSIKPSTTPPASTFSPCKTVITTSTNVPLCVRINDDDVDKCKVINRHTSKSPCIISKERGTTPFNVSPLICFSYSIQINSTERHFCYDSRTCSKDYLKQHIRTLLKFASNNLFNDKLCNITIKIERDDTKYSSAITLSNPKTLFELYDTIDKLLNKLDTSNNKKNELLCKEIKDLNNQEANLLLSKLIQYVYKTPLEAIPYTAISYRSYPPFLSIPLQSPANHLLPLNKNFESNFSPSKTDLIFQNSPIVHNLRKRSSYF